MSLQRAAVLVGVRSTGGLPQLQAVTSAIKDLADWATAQGFQYVKTITEETGPVHAQAIKDAICTVVDAGTYDQLIVYFAGHGVNIGRGERWLLSGAPADPNDAVNVPGSETLARFCGIPHVVLISDACRTAAEGIQAQSVTGVEIFPNLNNPAPEEAVDLFFASTVGSPALEIKDATTAVQCYEALYTGTLVEALAGKEPAILENDPPDSVVRARPLKKHLETAIAKKLLAKHLSLSINQTPDARITSDPAAWLSRFAPATSILPPRIAPTAPPILPTIVQPVAPPISMIIGPQPAAPTNLHAVADNAITEAIAGNSPSVDATVANAGAFVSTIGAAATPFGPMHYETQCGFKIQGIPLASAFSNNATLEQLSKELVRTTIKQGDAANVHLIFADGTSVVLPALQHYLTGLSFSDGELVSVTYEPSDTSQLWDPHDVARLRRLNAVVTAAARFGVFRLDDPNALALAQQLQFAKGKQPGLAVYAAYAYHDLHRRDRIAEMKQYLFPQIHAMFFDIAMLARDHTPINVFPWFPMLTQGWSLLSAFKRELPPALHGIQRDLRPSLWTLFGPHATQTIRTALQQGGVT